MAKRSSQEGGQMNTLEESTLVSTEEIENVAGKVRLHQEYAYEFPLPLEYPDPILHKKDEVLDAIDQIYNEYLSDFMQRKEKRINSKNPLEASPLYNLTVDLKFSQNLQKKIQKLVRCGVVGEVLQGLYESVESFVDALNIQIQELRGKRLLLQVICLTEAYHTLGNAAQEIGKITKQLFKNSEYTFEKFNRSLFYERIVKNCKDLLESVKSQNPKHYAIMHLSRMEKDLKYYKDSDMHAKLISLCQTHYIDTLSCDDSTNSEDESQVESIHNMSIDDLVSYINSEPSNTSSQQKPKKTKQKTKKHSEASTVSSSSSRDISLSPDLDREVNEFQRRLEQQSFPARRLKPRLTPAFIQNLRNKLQASKQ